MRHIILLLVCALTLVFSDRALGQDAAQPPGSKIITIEIMIAEFSAGGRADPPIDLNQGGDIAAKLRELDDQNALTALTRATLSSMDQTRTTVQFGHKAPMRAGRVAVGRRGEGGPLFQSSFELQHVGTQIAAMPRVLDDGRLVVELQIEKSQITDPPVNEPASSESDVDPAMQRISTLSTQATVNVPNGGSVLVGALSETGDKESGQTIVVVSARINE